SLHGSIEPCSSGRGAPQRWRVPADTLAGRDPEGRVGLVEDRVQPTRDGPCRARVGASIQLHELVSTLNPDTVFRTTPAFQRFPAAHKDFRPRRSFYTEQPALTVRAEPAQEYLPVPPFHRTFEIGDPAGRGKLMPFEAPANDIQVPEAVLA